MFLTKKNQPVPPKTKKNINKNKPLAGWQDEQDLASQPQSKMAQTSSSQHQANLLEGIEEPNATKLVTTAIKKEQSYYDWDTLNERSDMDCQKKLVEDIVQVGGIRIKPNDNMLSQFLKEIKGMNVSNIGSLLLSKLEVNYPFQVKAKSLYTIEFLSKKSSQYLSYFKAHGDKIRDFPQPDDNVDNYKKLLKTVLASIGTNPTASENDITEKPKAVFIDPCYYQEPPKSELSNFIESHSHKQKKTQTKRQIIGPGQAKAKLLQKKESKQHNKQLELISPVEESEPSPQVVITNSNGVSQASDNLLDLGSLNFSSGSKNNDLLN